MVTLGHRKVLVDKCNWIPASDRARVFWAGCARCSNRRRIRQRLCPRRGAGEPHAIRRDISYDPGLYCLIRLSCRDIEMRPEIFMRRDGRYRRGDRSGSYRMAKAARRGARPGRRRAATGPGNNAFRYGRQQDRCAATLSGAVPEPLSKATVLDDCLLCIMYPIRQLFGLKRT